MNVSRIVWIGAALLLAQATGIPVALASTLEFDGTAIQRGLTFTPAEWANGRGIAVGERLS